MVGDPYDAALSSAASIPTTTLALLVFFSQIWVLFAFSCFTGNYKDDKAAKNTKISVVKLTGVSLHPLLREFSELGFILSYIWICENRPLYAQGDKWHDLDFFYFLTFGLIVAAFFTVKENHKENTDLLNRDQTEEWKGWMQVVFLLYHYFHVSEAYNAVRVMISCYVWMTGFGNFSFFYIKRDFGFVRFYQMMWRLNFLVFFLCWTTNNLYILYYICPLHTFYFLLTYATMYSYSSINHSKYAARVKLFIVGVLIFAIWEFQLGFDTVFWFLSNERHEGYAVGGYGIKYEWHFRTGLDHYSTFFGMIFAMNFPQATLWLKQIEGASPSQNVIVKSCTGAVLLFFSYLYYEHVYSLPKLEYNALHPYVFIFPLTCYIFLRNSSKYLRGRRSTLLETIGKVTLETYLLQHHVWLTSNAKTLLVFLPDYPRLNFLVVTIIYFALSKRLYRLTINLRARCIPETSYGAMLSLAAISICFSICFITAWVLQKFEASWLVLFTFLAILSLGVQSFLERALRSATFLEGELKKKVNIYGFCVWAVVATLIALLLMNFGVAKSIAAEIGPMRPHLEIIETNRDLSCLKSVNQFSVREFDFKKIETSTDLYLNEEYVFHFEEPAEKYGEAKCRLAVYTPSQAESILMNKRILFVGRNSIRDLRKSFVSLFNLDLQARHQYFPSLEGKVHRLINKELNFTAGFSRNFNTPQQWDVIIFDLSALTWEVNENGEEDYYDTMDSLDGQTPFSAISDVIQMSSNDQAFIFVSPFHEKDYNPAITNRVASGEFINKRIGVVDAQLLASKADVSESEALTQALPQLVMNNLVILFNSHYNNLPRNLFDAEAVRSLALTTGKKGSGGGIASNPMYGIGMVILSGIMLFFMDNYFGIAYFFKRACAKDSGMIEWEESVRILHQSIGVTSLPSFKQSKENTSNEEGESFIKSNED